MMERESLNFAVNQSKTTNGNSYDDGAHLRIGREILANSTTCELNRNSKENGSIFPTEVIKSEPEALIMAICDVKGNSKENGSNLPTEIIKSDTEASITTDCNDDADVRLAMEMALAAEHNKTLSPTNLRLLIGDKNKQSIIIDEIYRKRHNDEIERKKQQDIINAQKGGFFVQFKKIMSFETP